MLQKIVTKLLKPRHFWRTVGFDELSELYTSMMLRSLALNLVGLFVPIFLFQIGYTIGQIAFFYTLFFGSRLLLDYAAALMVARIGPKHTMTFSYLLQVISLLLLLGVKGGGVTLWPVACIWGASSSFYFIAYHVDFSKVKHSEHGGKEVGYTFMLDRFSAIIGPLVGGVVATVFGAKYTIAASAAVFSIAIIPLFLTKEPVKVHQKISFKGLGKVFRRDAASVCGLGVENSLSVILWPLYVSVVVFHGSPYAKIGVLSAIGVSVAIFAAKMTGKITDKRRGSDLLNYSLIINIVVHGFRLFVHNFTGVLAINVANEAVTVGYRIPYTKGMYDAADELEGYRIAYITMMELTADVAKTAAWALLGMLTWLMPAPKVMQIGFLLAMLASAFITLQKFPALRATAHQVSK